MTSSFVSFRNRVESLFEGGLTYLETILAPFEKELGPVAEADLKVIGEAGVAAAAAALTSGGSLTLNAAEAALVVGTRAALATASTKGLQLTTQAAAAIVGGASLATTPATAPAV